MSKNKIVDVNVVTQYKEDMLRYAMFVNKVRSIPSIKDGLKTIHRRIIYSAYKDKKCVSKRTQIKSAELVGAVMGYYHPHGDTATYSSIKPMTNWFEINHPLFNGEGNWGTFQGDNSAAMRYTETYLSQFALDCVVGDLAKSSNVVDWSPTYNQARMEPEFLPVTVPLLLINGAFGIGYGILSNIPTHNINEVIDATIALIKNPNLKITLIPDQCMPCDIIDTDFDKICNTGLGTFKVRGRMDVDEIKIKNTVHPCLIIRSVPDSVYLDSIKKAIIELIDKKNALPQVVSIQDMSYLDKKTDKDVMKYVIVLKKGSDPNYVRDMLYKHTRMENSVTVSFEVLDGINSMRVSYTDYLKYFIEFRQTTKYRYYANMYQKADTALHEKDAFIKVLQSGEVDNIISMIKDQTDIDDTKNVEYLISKLNITDLQASYILNANIKKLSKGYLNKYIAEANELTKERTFADSMMKDPAKIEAEIVNELVEYKRKYGKPRNSKLVKASQVNQIPEGVFSIIITEKNYIKKCSAQDIGTFRGDTPKITMNINNTDSLILFDALGKVFKFPVHKIPVSDKNSNGIDLRILMKSITPVVQILSYDIIKKIDDSKKTSPTVLILSKNGFIKRLELHSILTAPANGYAYINLDADDAVSKIIVCSGADVVVYTHNKALRIGMNDIPVYKRNSKGVKTISSTKPFQMDGLSLMKPSSEYIIVITDSGKVNKLHADSLPRTDRNRAGTSLIKLAKGESIKYVLGGDDKNVLTLTTADKGNMQIPISELKVGSSISAGKRLVNKTTLILAANIK